MIMKKEKIIIACGSTGGHIFPAIEIAKSFQKKQQIDILFVGALNKMEMIRVPKAGFPIIGLWIQGFNRNSIFKNFLLPFKLIVSLFHSLIVLIYYKPIAVIGTGGYATGPVLLIASLLGIKTYIQEQNYFPGLTNRLLAKRVSQVFVANNNMEKFFPKDKLLNFGNPVRRDLKISIDLKTIYQSRKFFGLSNSKFTILVIGGSLGAEPLSQAVVQNLGQLNSNHIQLIWQTGDVSYNTYQQYQSDFCSVKRFINRMDLAYNAADIVISRSGAIAIAEICYLSKASILVPSPYVTDDHQTKNAQYLFKNKACLIAKQDRLSVILMSLIKKMKVDKTRNSIGLNANKLFNSNAAESIVNTILDNNKKLC